MDKSWINKPRNTKEYLDGVRDFIKFGMDKGSLNGKISCPCRRCVNNSYLDPQTVEEHLIWNGFSRGYTVWVFHGECTLPLSSNQPSSSDLGSGNMQDNLVGDDMTGLITDAFRHGTDGICDGSTSMEQTFVEEQMHESARYHDLIKDADEQLYPGCLKFSKISFLIHLFHIKYMNGWSGKSFTMLLKLLKDAFPEGTDLPSSYYEAKKVVNKLDLGYQKIHSCPKDCMLYHGGNADRESCNVCGSSRWRRHPEDEDDVTNKTKKPAKVLRYFPLIPLLKRLY